MGETPTPVPSKTTSSSDDNKVRSGLIFGALALAAAIIFGLLYLFVLAPTVPGGSVGWFLFSFATGLTMIVMPCTLPLAFVIVPLSMGKGILRGLSMALAFGVGIAVMLSTYGIIAAVLGGFALEFLGNDIEPIKNWVYFIAGLFALVFALSEIGLLNVHMPTYSGAAPAFIQKRGEIIKAFLLGLFLGNVGVGCPHPATPLILIEIASSGDILYGWLMFLVHAIGRVLPLLLLAFLAILGVNGLSWLMAHKPTVERVTGWAMVFVAGFILTLGLFTHDWWVNSGIHNALEAITQESFFNSWFNNALGQNVAHMHGLEEGAGLFGQPLWWGHWFLVLVWLIPIWWWYAKRRNNLYSHPTFAFKRLEHEVDRLEKERDRIEEMTHIDELNTGTDLKALKSQITELRKQRRAAAQLVSYGETGGFKSDTVREYEVKILGMRRNFLIFVSITLALVFIYFLPQNFYYKSVGGGDHHDDGAMMVDTIGIHQMPDGTIMNTAGDTLTGASKLPDGSFLLADGTTVDKYGNPGPTHNGTPFSNSTAGLPEAGPVQFVELSDGEEYDITAEYVQKEVGNRTLRMMAYNRTIPGPFIKVQKDATVFINFTNKTDIDQTIHSHGLRLNNLFDGVPNVTQDVVKPGQSFRYELYFKDEGMAWYHPHTRDDYGQEMGLYGVYLVEPLEADYWNPVNREVPLVLDDILIENNEIATFYEDVIDHVLLGRFGNEFMVNGVTGYELEVEQGETIRFQVTNVSNARTYRLSIPGVQMKIVGAEWGRHETETFAHEFLISPSERVVFEAYFPETGDFELINRLPDRSFKLAEFEVEPKESTFTSYAEEFSILRENEAERDVFTQYRNEYLNQPPDKELLLTINLSGQVDHSAHAHGQASTAMNPMMSMGTLQWEDPTNSDKVNTSENVEWILRDTATGKESMNIPVSDWTFRQGDVVKIRLKNDAMAAHVMQHPIHFHGQRFVVLSQNGVPNQNMVWKDVAMVPPGDYIDILVDMSITGEWMAHCHISEHLHGGMMMQYRVEDESGNADGDEYRASLPAGIGHAGAAANSSTDNVAPGNFTFDAKITNENYFITAAPNSLPAGKQREFTIAIYDINDNSVLTSPNVDMPLKVTFVKSDNSEKVVTYPGNTTFKEVVPVPNAPSTPSEPADDGHNHMHMLPLINTAYADAGHDAAVGDFSYTYTMPIVFPSQGYYRGFVEFVPDGATEVEVVSFNIEVSADGFSVDNFGWSGTMKWWILLIISIILMIPLVYAVRWYVNVDNIKLSEK